MAAYRLELAYLPSLSFPELTARLWLPEALEADELTRLYVQPLESAIRAVGDVTSMAGWVDGSSASLTVRFKAGTDAERKAARLSEGAVHSLLADAGIPGRGPTVRTRDSGPVLDRGL